jgi:hypothetical protein
MNVAFDSISAYGWNQLGNWLRRTNPTSRENVPPVPSAASTRSENSRCGTFSAVSICPISDPVQNTIDPSCASVSPAASRARRSS